MDHEAFKSVYTCTVNVANASDEAIEVRVVQERKSNAQFATVHAQSYLSFWPWNPGKQPFTKKGAVVYVSIRFARRKGLPIDDYPICTHHSVIIDKSGKLIQKKKKQRMSWHTWLDDGPVWVDDEGVNHKTW